MDEVEKLMRQLKEGDATARGLAAEELGRKGEKAAVAAQALVEAMNDANPWVQEKAARALGLLGEKAVPALAKALNHRNSFVRKEAAQALGLNKEKAVQAAPALVEMLKDRKESVQEAALNALIRLGLPAISFLSKAARRRENACIRQEIKRIIRLIQQNASKQPSLGVRDMKKIRKPSERKAFERTAFPNRALETRKAAERNPKTFAKVAR